MNPANIFWAGNLKFLRNRKGISQEKLANELKITRAKLAAHENGNTVNPPAEILLRASDYFRISIDSLLRVDLSRLGELQLRELEAGNDVYMTGSKIRVLAITVDKDNKENVEYVPVKAKAGYAAGHRDPEYLATLPKFTFPDLPRGGTYRAFPITGDSMLPFPEDSLIIGRYVSDWKDLNAGTACIVVLKDQDFVFKLVTVLENGDLLLESLNKVYSPYMVACREVLELWSYYRHQTSTMPEPAGDLQELKSLVLDIRYRLLKNLDA